MSSISHGCIHLRQNSDGTYDYDGYNMKSVDHIPFTPCLECGTILCHDSYSDFCGVSCDFCESGDYYCYDAGCYRGKLIRCKWCEEFICRECLSHHSCIQNWCQPCQTIYFEICTSVCIWPIYNLCDLQNIREFNGDSKAWIAHHPCLQQLQDRLCLKCHEKLHYNFLLHASNCIPH